MIEDKIIYVYSLSGNEQSFKTICASATKVDGVLSASLEENKLVVSLSEHASEYDVFCALVSLGEEIGVEVDYLEDENDANATENEYLNDEAVEQEASNEQVSDTSSSENLQIPEDEKPWRKRFLPQFIEIGISLILLLICEIFSFKANTESFIYLIAFTIVGYEIIWEAISEIIKKNYFNHCIFPLLASIVSLFVASYFEATVLVLAFQTANVLCRTLYCSKEDKLKKRFFYDYCKVLANGEEEMRFAKNVEVGSVVKLKKGDVVPFDSIVVNGQCEVNTFNYSDKNESIKQDVGSKIYGGAVICSGEVEVKVEKIPSESVSGLIYKKLTNNKTDRENNFKNTCKKVLIGGIAIFALVAFLVPVFFISSTKSYSSIINDWVYLALILLAVSNVTIFLFYPIISWISAVNRALSLGVFVNSEQELTKFGNSKSILFNEPGALSLTTNKIDKVIPMPAYKGKLLNVIKSYGADVENVNTCEIVADDGNKLVLAEYDYFIANGINIKKVNYSGNVRYVVLNNELIGALVYNSGVKKNSYGAVKELMDEGVTSTVVTGVSEKFSELAGVVKFEKPDDVTFGDDVITVGVNSGNKITFSDLVKDGVVEDNTVLPSGEVKSVAKFIKLAKRFCKTSKFNLAFCIELKAFAVIISVTLFFSMQFNSLWIAVLIDLISTIVCGLIAISNDSKVY